MNSFEQSYVGNCTYYDMIENWMECSYLEKFLENGKVVFTLFVNKYQGGKLNTLFLYLPHKEIHRKTEKC